MNFLWTTIYVNNLEESISFYSNLLKLKVMNRFPAGPGVEIAFLGNSTENETLVELLKDTKVDSVKHNDFIFIGFSVDSVEEMLEIVKKNNIPVHNGPIETPGSTFFTIKDPNGLSIQFFQQK